METTTSLEMPRQATPTEATATQATPMEVTATQATPAQPTSPQATARQSTPRKAARRQSTPSSIASSTSSPGSGPRSPNRPRNKVHAGRIAKALSARKSPLSPVAEQLAEEVDKLDDEERELELKRYEEMQDEKKFFPRADEWHPDEVRCFEILYMRQYSPLIPSFWDMDFKGIPIPEILFQTSAVDQPVVYSYSGQEYHATRALINLIELTATVRCFNQADRGRKASQLLKKTITAYIKWAAVDGGYDELDVIPNILVEIVDLELTGKEITQWMKAQLADLAKKHRDHLRIEDDDTDIPTNNSTGRRLYSAASDAARFLMPDMFRDRALPSIEGILGKAASAQERRRRAPRYSRSPPVLYGLFIIHSTVMVLTADATKEGDAFHTSYQVDISFNSKDQGVWNAMTTAIVVCLARDDMIDRREDFEVSLLEPESDPDV